MKKLLGSLLTLGITTLVLFGVTRAFFGNTEKSLNNTFIAGSIDLLVDSKCHFNGIVCENGYWDGNPQKGECDCTWEPKDLKGSAIFNVTDIKPGDVWEDTISLHVETNPAWICAEISNVNHFENGCTEPEGLVDSTCDEPGEKKGELWDNLLFSVWMDNGEGDHKCNNVKDSDESYLFENQKASDLKYPIADSQTGKTPISDACIGVAWTVASSVDNIIQGDSVTGDITFKAYQARNNENFVCYPSTLTVEKTVINDNGGNAEADDFQLKIDGQLVLSGVPFNVNPGIHTVSETNLAGYQAGEWGGDCNKDGKVSISFGEHKKCTITNDDLRQCFNQADVMLVLDRSASIDATELSQLKTAATSFVNALNPNGGVHMGQSSFSTNGTLDRLLTGNKADIVSAINGLASGGYTNLYEGINLARGELKSIRDRNDTVTPDYMIVITDGQPNRPGCSGVSSCPAARNAAANEATATKAEGVTIYVVGVGSDVDATYLKNQIATSPSHYFGIEGYGDLENILKAIANCENPQLPPVRITLLSDGFGTGSTDTSFDEDPDIIGIGGWLEGGVGQNSAEKRQEGNGNNSPSPNGGRFAVIFSADGSGNNGWICRSINTTGYKSLELSYYWRGDSDANNSDDRGRVEYKIGGNCSDGNSGSGWTLLQDYSLQTWNNWTYQLPFALPPNTDNTSFLLRFRTHDAEDAEFFRIDGVLLTGLPI